MIIQLLVDNPNSWIISYLEKLKEEIIIKFSFSINLIYKHEDVKNGDILVLLSCIKMFKHLNLNTHNLVIHESDLPKGRGMSPLTWQVLEGKSDIPVTLLEASEELDAGVIYGQKVMELNGSELVDELRDLQFKVTKNLIIDFLDNYLNIQGVSQDGTPTFYRARNINDSKLDISKSIEEQFNLFRISDNIRYPAWFEKNGFKYKLEINKIKE
jgi:methionyl-tRNA formyltransferase